MNAPNGTQRDAGSAVTGQLHDDAETLTGRGSGRRAPVQQSCARLLDLLAAAAYLGVSYWTMRDLVASGRVPAVRLPAVRLDLGVRRNSKAKSPAKSRQRQLVEASDPRLGGRSVRKLLVDRQDLDRLIDASKETGTGTL